MVMSQLCDKTEAKGENMKTKSAIMLGYVWGMFFFTIMLQSGFSQNITTNTQDYLGRPAFPDPAQAAQWADKIQHADKCANVDAVRELFQPILEEHDFDGAKVPVIKYSDAILHNAIVDLIFKMCEKKKANPAWFEVGEEGYDITSDVVMYAESTFSPRLYEGEIFGTPLEVGKLNIRYLSVINTSHTLEVILKSTLDEQGDLFFAEKKKKLTLDCRETLRLLSYMRKTSPKLLSDNEIGIRRFIERGILYASKDSDYLDYYMRDYTLDVIAFYGKKNDIPYLRKLVSEARVMKTGGVGICQPEELKAKLNNILKNVYHEKL